MNTSSSPTLNNITLEENDPSFSASFPYRTGVYGYHDTSYPWHWHNEVEFFYMRSGVIDYHTPSGIYPLVEGDVGMVNASVLHMPCGRPGVFSEQEDHIFLPSFISGAHGSVIETRYVLPLVENRSIDMLIFRKGTETAARAVELMHRATALHEEKPFGYEAGIRSLMTELWLTVLQAAELSTQPAEGSPHDDARIREMMRYIADHYGEKVTLGEIAGAALIGERECCRCFQRQLGMSPIEYLMDFRISKACELLHSTEMSVLEIGIRCGFSSPSYFGKIFRRKLGYTPRDYRNARLDIASTVNF